MKAHYVKQLYWTYPNKKKSFYFGPHIKRSVTNNLLLDTIKSLNGPIKLSAWAFFFSTVKTLASIVLHCSAQAYKLLYPPCAWSVGSSGQITPQQRCAFCQKVVECRCDMLAPPPLLCIQHMHTHTRTHTHTADGWVTKVFVSTDARRPDPRSVIGSTVHVGAYPRGTGSNPVEGKRHFFPSYHRLYLSSFSDTHTHTHTHTHTQHEPHFTVSFSA